MVYLSGGESYHWCDVSVCVLASDLLVLVLLPVVNLVSEVDLSSVSVFDCEIVEPQTVSSPESVAPLFRWSVKSARKRKQAWRQCFSSRCPRERQ